MFLYTFNFFDIIHLTSNFFSFSINVASIRARRFACTFFYFSKYLLFMYLYNYNKDFINLNDNIVEYYIVNNFFETIYNEKNVFDNEFSKNFLSIQSICELININYDIFNIIFVSMMKFKKKSQKNVDVFFRL